MTGLAAVTGGTGFIGRACVAALAAAGWNLRLLVRRDPTFALPSGVVPEIVLGDLADVASLRRLVAGADVVVHAAGATMALGRAGFDAVNEGGTARLAAEVAQAAPGCRVVHLSSQAARQPQVSAYAASKRAGEAVLAVGLPAGNWVMLRPGIVYGPGDSATAQLRKLAAGPLVPVPTSPEPRLAVVHVDDVAAAVAAFCQPGASGCLYEISDAAPEGHAWRQVVRAARGGGVPWFLPVPDTVLLASGVAADGWAALTRRPSLFGLGKAREFLHRDWRPDPALRPPPAIWQPAIGLEEGFRRLGG